MKRYINLLLLALVLLASPTLAQDEAEAPIRVACVGDSITFGAGIPERERWCYPALLQDMFGENYDVRNFGRSGATLLSQGNIPYIGTRPYRDALAFEPDVVILNLGANDSKARNWAHANDFVEDYLALIDSFQQLESRPRILVCSPMPAWVERGIRGSIIHDEIVPFTSQVAKQTGSELIDMHSPLRNSRNLFSDGVHPNSFGAEWMARRVYESIRSGNIAPLDWPELSDAVGLENRGRSVQFDFHGYDGIRFPYDAVRAMVVRPRVAAEGRPWVWRARFWGHEPQADIAMLERGWHIVYCEVGSLYGNPEAVERWDGFYQAMRDAGLGEDMVLEGMSRGGLIIYNWAKANPALVSGIYGDAPVCDIRSWPGGLGDGRGSAGDWQRAMAAYELNADDIDDFVGNPFDGLEVLAEQGVPLLHIVGDVDNIVPVSENTAILEERYRALGGDITVIHKPGVNHHPHSLPDPAPIVDFFLDSTDRKINFATVTRPSVEFRSGAGWGDGSWWTQHAMFNALGETNDIDVVFLGDSITQGMTGVNDRLSHVEGQRTFDQHFGDLKAAGFGLAGDRTEHLLYRIENGNFDNITPKVIVLMIGVNNINAAKNTGEETAEGTRAVVAALRDKVPGAHILVLGSFPTGPAADSPPRLQVDALHASIASLGDDDAQVTYMDLRHLFLNDNGTPNANMRGDNIHITGAGYRAWFEAIEPTIRELLAE